MSNVLSVTFGDLPEGVSYLVVPHEWDNKNPSEQRDWAILQIAYLQRQFAKLESDIDAIASALLGAGKTYQVEQLPDQIRVLKDANTKLEADLLNTQAIAQGVTHHETCCTSSKKYKALEAENERLTDTNKRLNRRVGALEHAVNTQSEKGAWYRYFMCGLDLYQRAQEECKTLKEENTRLNKMRTHCENCGANYVATGLEARCPCLLKAENEKLEALLEVLEQTREALQAAQSRETQR